LSRLSRDPALKGRILPLAFHVDYWNYIGWNDPFSSGRWTERQHDYGRIFQSRSIYTPQLVVNGQAELIGSDEARVRAAIARAASVPMPARVALQEVKTSGDRLTVTLQAGLSSAIPVGGAMAVVVLFENGLTTRVAKGENRDQTLHNDFVVRRLETRAVPSATPSGGEKGESTLTVDLTLEAGWNRKELGVAVFVQDGASRQILGATSKFPAL